MTINSKQDAIVAWKQAKHDLAIAKREVAARKLALADAAIALDEASDPHITRGSKVEFLNTPSRATEKSA